MTSRRIERQVGRSGKTECGFRIATWGRGVVFCLRAVGVPEGRSLASRGGHGYRSGVQESTTDDDSDVVTLTIRFQNELIVRRTRVASIMIASAQPSVECVLPPCPALP